MAGCASDDGTGVWCSKSTIARDLEYGKRTVQVAVDDMVQSGLIAEVGNRRCAHGYTVEYRICLDVVKTLEPTQQEAVKKAKSERGELPPDGQNQRGAGAAPVQEMHPTRAGAAPHGVQELHPNRTGTVKESCSEYVGGASAAITQDQFDEFWKAHPRPRNRERCRKLLAKAVSDGVPVARLLTAAERYRAEQAGNAPRYVCYADSWLDNRRWEDFPDQAGEAADSLVVSRAAVFWAKKIQSGGYAPQSAISKEIAACMIAEGLVDAVQLRRAGIIT